eukprot:5396752-Pleurochrysis_carterae.AAC.6
MGAYSPQRRLERARSCMPPAADSEAARDFRCRERANKRARAIDTLHSSSDQSQLEDTPGSALFPSTRSLGCQTLAPTSTQDQTAGEDGALVYASRELETSFFTLQERAVFG